MTQVQSINSDSYNNYNPRVRSPLRAFATVKIKDKAIEKKKTRRN